MTYKIYIILRNEIQVCISRIVLGANSQCVNQREIDRFTFCNELFRIRTSVYPASRVGQTRVLGPTKNLGHADTKKRKSASRSLFVTRRRTRRLSRTSREYPDGYRWSLDAQIQLVE